jgi:pimeloyl-ACP methyl ester carboxylesterase/DNA-binding CsgD family transcriptional regulator
MSAPPVQYVQTSDGMSIAYTACGQGEPFVFMPVFLGHVDGLWETSFSSLLADLAARFLLVNYDSRGQGLSTRNLPDDVALDDFMLDFEAIRDRLGLKRFVLLGSCNSSFQAVHYAIRHPEHVSALVLVNASLSPDAWRLGAVYNQLPAEDWELFLYNIVPPDRTPEAAHKMVQWLREGMTQRDYLASVPAWRNAGLEDVLSQLRTPTLILHSKNFRLRAIEGPIELARRLPDARLVTMDSFNLFGDPGQAMQAIDEFFADLGQRAPSKQNEGISSSGRLTAREVDVLRLIAGGATNREIADKLVVSARTVERHITHIYGKIGARGKADATAYALRHSLDQELAAIP